MFILIISIIIISIVIFLIVRKKTFAKRKSHIMNLYSSVLSDMNMDFRDISVSAMAILEISRSIQHLTDEITRTRGDIDSWKQEEKKWMIDIIEEFSTVLKIWIHRHIHELEKVEESLANQKTEKLSEKAILDLAQTRLESHRKILMQI